MSKKKNYQIDLNKIHKRLSKPEPDKLVISKWLFDRMIEDGLKVSKDQFHVIETRRTRLATDKVHWNQVKQRFEPV